MEPGTLKMLTNRQKTVIYIIKFMCRYALTKKVEAGQIDELIAIEEGKRVRAIDAFSIHTPDISVRDTLRLAGVLQQLATSRLLAEQQGWIAKEMAAKVFANIARELGQDVDVAAGAGGSC